MASGVGIAILIRVPASCGRVSSADPSGGSAMRTNRRPSTGSRPIHALALTLGFSAACALSPSAVHADAPPAASGSPAAAKPPHVVQTVHAWRDFLTFASEIESMAPDLHGGPKRTIA